MSPLVEVCTLMLCPFLSLHMALCVPLASSGLVVFPPKLIDSPIGSTPGFGPLINYGIKWVWEKDVLSHSL